MIAATQAGKRSAAATVLCCYGGWSLDAFDYFIMAS